MLLDRNMPEMNGIACAKKIIEYDPAARIIFVSGYDDEGPDGIDDSVKAFIKDYIIKPVNVRELSQKLKELFGD